MGAPDVMAYDSYRRFLEAWWTARKEASPQLSQRWFARRLGSRDPSALSHVLKGRRPIPPENLHQWTYALELEGDDARYFEVLVAFGDARDRLQREAAFGELVAIRTRARSVELDGPLFRMMSRWMYSVVHELAACDGGLPDDAAHVAERLSPPITEDEARDALDTLVEIGMLTRDGDRLVQKEPAVRTSAEVTHLGSYAYHRAMHDHAGAYLERLWDAEGAARAAQDSAFHGMTLAVPTSRLPELRQRLVELQMQLAGTTTAWSAEADRVVQLNVHLFPVTRAPAD